MQITIDVSQPLTAKEAEILAVLLGREAPTPAPAPEPAPKKEKPAKEDETPPAAPAEETPETPATPEEPSAQQDESTDLKGDAIAKATELVSTGKGGEVKKALASVGAKRVSELKGKKIAEFLEALDG